MSKKEDALALLMLSYLIKSNNDREEKNCDNCEYVSKFKDGLLLCRRKKNSIKVDASYCCKHFKKAFTEWVEEEE